MTMKTEFEDGTVYRCEWCLDPVWGDDIRDMDASKTILPDHPRRVLGGRVYCSGECQKKMGDFIEEHTRD